MSADTQTASLLERREVLGSAYRLFYQEPLTLVRGSGVWVFDAEGKRYLDAYNNVPVVGHCHPRVVEALSLQAALLNTHTRYLSEGLLSYAERLTAEFPAPLRTAMFTCTGSEANDLALRIARTVTGGTGVIVTGNAYHGVTSALAEMSPSLGLPVADHVRTIAAPDSYRGVAGSDTAGVFAEEVRTAIASLKAAGIKPAALLVDTLFSSDGLFTEPAGTLAQAAAAIREAGGLFIADEVQGGFGRVGSSLWAFTRHNVVPDLVTLGKPMGNGHPIAGLVGNSDMIAEFGQLSRYFNTFGGNTVSAAVGSAVLDVIQSEGLMEHAKAVGENLGLRLMDLASRHPLIGDVRGVGLYWALELVITRRDKTPATAEATMIVNALRENGVLIGSFGPHANVLKIRPPLPFNFEQVDILLSALERALPA